MKHVSFFAIPAIILTLIFIFLPSVLWIVDRIFRKPLEQRLFVVSWNLWGIVGAAVCWGLTWWFWG